MTDHKRLWNACTAGNIELVNKLLTPENVNYCDLEENRSLLYRACGHGQVEVVKRLLREPGIDVNKQTTIPGSPLYIAAQQNHMAVIDLLLADPRVDPNLKSRNYTAFTARCIYQGYQLNLDILRTLLAHPRIDVGVIQEYDNSNVVHLACWSTCDESTEILQILLKSPRIIPLVNQRRRNGQTALQVAIGNDDVKKAALLLAVKEVDITDSIRAACYSYDARIVSHMLLRANVAEVSRVVNFSSSLPLHNDLIQRFLADPEKARAKLRFALGYSASLAAGLFVNVVFVSDGYLKSGVADEARFFNIAAQLPIELQMLLCNRVYGLSRTLIPYADSEAAFRAWS